MRIKFEYLIILLFLFILLFTSFYHFEQKISFGWDQERDANVVWNILKESKLTLIGPRAVSEDSFFLGPFWYYLLLPFYYIFNLNPLSIGVFGIILQSVTLVAIFIVSKKLFGKTVGLLSSFIYLPLGGMIVWNPILIPIISVILIYLINNISKGSKKLIPITFFIIGLSFQVHFQSIFFIFPLFISLYLYFRKTHKLLTKELFIGSVLFLLTFLPLFLFDIRHNFLNIKGVLRLFFYNSGSSVDFFNHFMQGIYKFVASISSPLSSVMAPFMAGLLVLGLVTFGYIKSNLEKNIKITLLSFIFLPPILFSFHKGTLSEYYFTVTFIPIIFGLSIFLKYLLKMKFGFILFFVFIILAIFQKVNNFKTSENLTNLFFQKQAVLYIINQKTDAKFNVSFDVPINADAGFRYLFKYFKKEPENIPEAHLWTIIIPPTGNGVKPDAVFGNIGVLRR